MYNKPEYKKRTYYHIYNRGHRKARIFRGTKDYTYFVNQVHRYLSIYDIVLVSYCLMPNHFHFVLRLGESKSDISKYMHRLKTSYASYFNRRYNLVGTPFQGRFQAREIVGEDDLHSIVDYIKNNPVEAELVRSYEKYRWIYIKRRYL